MILRAVLAALIAASTAAAQSGENGAEPGTALRRAIELPSHRALMDVIAAPDTTLKPFETDGCSGGLSSAWTVVADVFPDFHEIHEGRPPWEGCCIAHDRRYHDAAGTADAAASFAARLEADAGLRSCVIASGETRIDGLAARYGASPNTLRLAYAAIGDAMFNAVRFGGGPCSGLPWRWGYGYPNCLPGLP